MVSLAAKRVARRFVGGPELPEWDFGRFHIKAPSKAKQALEEALGRVDKDFAKAGFPLGKRIEVEAGTGRTGKAAYFHPSQNYIEVMPSGFRGALYEVLVHEMTHWFHHNRLGLGNRVILDKHNEVVEGRGGPEEAFADLKALEKKLKSLKRKRTNLIKKVGKAGSFSLPGYEDRQLRSGKYVREVTAVGTQAMRGSPPFIKLKVTNPSPSDLKQEDTMFGVRIVVPVQEVLPGLPALASVWERLDDEIRETERGILQARRQDTTEAYKVPGAGLDDWMPTEYAKNDFKEWFAELMTVAVLHPARLSKPVLNWLRSLT